MHYETVYMQGLSTLQALAASSSGAPYLSPDVQTERRPQRRECAQSDTPYIPGIEFYCTHIIILFLLLLHINFDNMSDIGLLGASMVSNSEFGYYTLPSLSFLSSFKLFPISNVLSIVLNLLGL